MLGCGAGELPWARINDFVLELGTASDSTDLLRRSVKGIGTLVPYDTDATVFDVERRIIANEGMPDDIAAAYNEHYRLTQWPYYLEDGPAYPSLDFFKLNTHHVFGPGDGSEYFEDFCKPNHLEYSLLGMHPSRRIIFGLARSRRSRPFSEDEGRILGIVHAHLCNLYSILNKICSDATSIATAEELRFRFPALSKREAEVASCLCMGLTAPEIGTKLFISERTVEAHVAHVYDKLDVRGRRAAVELLKGGSEETRHG